MREGECNVYKIQHRRLFVYFSPFNSPFSHLLLPIWVLPAIHPMTLKTLTLTPPITTQMASSPNLPSSTSAIQSSTITPYTPSSLPNTTSSTLLLPPSSAQSSSSTSWTRHGETSQRQSGHSGIQGEKWGGGIEN